MKYNFVRFTNKDNESAGNCQEKKQLEGIFFSTSIGQKMKCKNEFQLKLISSYSIVYSIISKSLLTLTKILR
jgi:hypothetical protein